MYSIEEYKKLVSKYGSYSSWAIWNYKNVSDTTIIDENFNKLHSNYVLIGLNISRILRKNPWSNFHDNSYARRLKYACNDTILRGSYITDLFKDMPEPKSSNVQDILTAKIIKQNLSFFNQEMKNVGTNSGTKFILLGKLTAHYYSKYFSSNNNHTYFCTHYSYQMASDQEWVESFWNKLSIKQDYNKMIGEYKKFN